MAVSKVRHRKGLQHGRGGTEGFQADHLFMAVRWHLRRSLRGILIRIRGRRSKRRQEVKGLWQVNTRYLELKGDRYAGISRTYA